MSAAASSLRFAWILKSMGEDLIRRAANSATQEELEAFNAWGPYEPIEREADQEVKMLLVRLCGSLECWNQLHRLMKDADPGVRWLVFKTMSEMDGHAKPKRHDLMLRRAARFGQAFREGRAKRIPWRFEDPVWGLCDREACDRTAS